MPMLPSMSTVAPLTLKRSSSVSRMRPATSTAASRDAPGRITANSSPPRRDTTSPSRTARRKRRVRLDEFLGPGVLVHVVHHLRGGAAKHGSSEVLMCVHAADLAAAVRVDDPAVPILDLDRDDRAVVHTTREQTVQRPYGLGA